MFKWIVNAFRWTINLLQHERYGRYSRTSEFKSLGSLLRSNLGEAINHLKVAEAAMHRKLALPPLSEKQRGEDKERLNALGHEIVRVKLELYEKSQATITQLKPLVERESSQ